MNDTEKLLKEAISLLSNVYNHNVSPVGFCFSCDKFDHQHDPKCRMKGIWDILQKYKELKKE